MARRVAMMCCHDKAARYAGVTEGAVGGGAHFFAAAGAVVDYFCVAHGCFCGV